MQLIERALIGKTIRGMPKAELHVHIEGTLEPGRMLELAEKNGVRLGWTSVEELESRYRFSNLEGFLDIYFQGSEVLVEEEDFFDLARAYLRKAHSQNIVHTEIFFAPQSHTRRGIEFSTVIKGIHRAQAASAEEFGMSSALIMCLLRDMSVDSALGTLDEAIPYGEWITGVGLGSAELGNPPSKFKEVFDRVHSEGFRAVAHAGEEGPAEYVREAIESLRVSRIDHGNACLDDEELVEVLASGRIPLTVCPLSNLRLGVVDRMGDHPLAEMLRRGLAVTVNSDDPAYFGGYVNENYLAVQEALGLGVEEIHTLARNSFEASFLPEAQKEAMIAELDDFMRRSASR